MTKEQLIVVMRLAILGATSQIAKDLVQSFAAQR